MYRKISIKLHFEIFHSVLFHEYKSIKRSYHQIFEKYTIEDLLLLTKLKEIIEYFLLLFKQKLSYSVV